jgi:hypothetical protein
LLPSADMGALSKTAEKLLLLCLGCLFVIGCRSDGQTIVPEVDAVEVPFEARPYAYQHDVLDNR